MLSSPQLFVSALERARRIALRSVRVDQIQSRSDFLTPTKEALMHLAAGCLELSREVVAVTTQGQQSTAAFASELPTLAAQLADLQLQLQILAGDTETVSELTLEQVDGTLPELPPSMWASASVVTVYYKYDHAEGNQGFALPASVPLGKRLILHNTHYDARLQVNGLPGVVVNNGLLPLNGGVPGSWRVPRFGGIDSGSVIALRSAGLIGVSWTWRVEAAFLVG